MSADREIPGCKRNGTPAQRPEVDRANVVLYLDITATHIIMILINVLIIKRTAFSATDIAPYALAQHRIADLAVEYRVCIS